ncbi:MAG: hypothetical protein Fur002_12810 [Anaerolineales bacterium]
MLKNFVKIFSGDPTKKTADKFAEVVAQVNQLEAQFEALSDEALRAKTDEFKKRITQSLDGIEQDSARRKMEQETLDEILPEAFAAVREASKRAIGLRHYDVQLIGGAALHHGSIAEMKTGEGKTLVATLPVYLNALTGRGVHLITVNDYLARRDARWMAPVYQMLGLSVGVLQMAAATENGKKAFLVDSSRESPHEDQHHLRLVERAEAYRADVTYGTNSEFGFDYLRDNMARRLSNRVQRGHYFAIVDEVDNVLIDEARTPLIISGPAEGGLDEYKTMAQIVKQLKPEDYEVDEKNRNVNLTEVGVAHVEKLLDVQLLDPDRPEDLNPEQARLMGFLQQALRAQFLFFRNKDYLVTGGKVIIVDEFTGRQMPGRRWSDGLHQAVEAKEGVKVEPENVTYATITLQNYFRMYQKLAGMTGTALTEAEEFNKIYKIEVMPVPTNLEYQSLRTDATLIEHKDKDEEGYSYSYYTPKNDEAKIFYKRKDYPDVIYRTAEAKLRAIVTEIIRYHALGRPLLVGTTSVESSDKLSNRLNAEPVRRLLQVTLIRHAYLTAKNIEEDGRLIAELAPFNEELDKITPDALRTFIKPYGLVSINPEEPNNLQTLLNVLRLPPNAADRLKALIQGGVPRQVLNARKHTEESKIIAGAGAFGAVTIATNMAGRGVDIKLGGELAEEVISAVNRVLRKAGYADPFDMTLEERRQALLKLDSSQHGIYGADVKTFLQYFDNMERVKLLGGLHVIGSERHEARRIDNQLRGRAARQGDPGSSRFYLSLQDDLMRLFGGEQVSNLMQRLSVDDSLPLEVRLVSNIIEGSQTRVEGANFDMRKHLLEYDDVLNQQRQQIYAQRDKIFIKEDLREDIADMLDFEVSRRVDAGLEDEEGMWRLIAWLDQVQPPFESLNGLFPPYGLKRLLGELQGEDIKASTSNLIARALSAEEEHTRRAIETLVKKTGEALGTQISERSDALDAYFDGLRDVEEAPRPQKMIEEINALLRVNIKPNGEILRALAEDPQSVKDQFQQLAAQQWTAVYLSRLLNAIQSRIGDALAFPQPLPAEWDEIEDVVRNAAQEALTRRREKLLTQIERDLEALLLRGAPLDDSGKLQLLLNLTQGAFVSFDQRTHKQVKKTYTRLTYTFLAAQLLKDKDAETIKDDVMNHLEQAEEALRAALGLGEYERLKMNAAHLADFGAAARIAFGEEKLSAAASSLTEEERAKLIDSIGWYLLNEGHRQLLLNAFSDLWVEYLTKIEALRISIGLEAYAQRDPLVQYKSRASEMFKELLEEVRALVITRAFAARPRRIEIAPIELAESQAPAAIETPKENAGGSKKKRKRH